MMKIQKGLVKDQGYPDVVCSYGTCDDGTVYYFIENGTLSNGNIIATTNLKEAIGHAQNTSLGLINPNGDVLVSFENRSIKIINDQLLLVERTNPISENVVLAMKDRTDPLAANKLVTTAANIKDRMNAKIGRDGKFLYNNQFGEASIFGINGNPIIDGYYSYIAMDEDIIYYSKNIKDDAILEYSINAPVQNNNLPVQDNNVTTEVSVTNDDTKLDVTDTGVTKEDIDREIANDVANISATNTAFDNNQVVSAEVSDQVNNPAEEIPNNNAEEVQDKVENEQIELPTGGMPLNEEVSNMNANLSNSLDVEKGINALNETLKPFTSENKIQDNIPLENDKKELDFSEFKKDHIDSDNFNNLFDNKYEPDTVIENANNVMKKLIKQNRNQKDLISEQDSKIESLETLNQQLTSQCEDMNNKNEDLERKILRYEDIVKKYASKITMLSEKVDSQGETIKAQQKRLDILEPQIAGRNQLGNTLEEAMEVLSNTDEIDNVYTKGFVA